MTDKWIGHHIVLTNEDGIYDDDGVKYLDLLSLEEDFTVDKSTHPLLDASSVAVKEVTTTTLNTPGSYEYIGVVGTISTDYVPAVDFEDTTQDTYEDNFGGAYEDGFGIYEQDRSDITSSITVEDTQYGDITNSRGGLVVQGLGDSWTTAISATVNFYSNSELLWYITLTQTNSSNLIQSLYDSDGSLVTSHTGASYTRMYIIQDTDTSTCTVTHESGTTTLTSTLTNITEMQISGSFEKGVGTTERAMLLVSRSTVDSIISAVTSPTDDMPWKIVADLAIDVDLYTGVWVGSSNEDFSASPSITLDGHQVDFIGLASGVAFTEEITPVDDLYVSLEIVSATDTDSEEDGYTSIFVGDEGEGEYYDATGFGAYIEGGVMDSNGDSGLTTTPTLFTGDILKFVFNKTESTVELIINDVSYGSGDYSAYSSTPKIFVRCNNKASSGSSPDLSVYI